MKDAVIVLSGGMDSVTLLYERAAEIALAVTFDYGSNHNRREEACAKEQCRRLGVGQVTIPLGFIGQYFESSLLAGAEAVPEGPYAAENMQSTVVPFRNGIMLAVAAGLAESVSQYFAVLTNTRSVGVMGDGRTYDYTLALRAVTTSDFMTADWARIPYDVLDRVSTRIVNEVVGINRIC